MPTLTDTLFPRFVDIIIEHEGGARFVNHSSDPGGATKWGISLSYARYQKARFDLDGDGDVDADDIRVLTREQAIEAYRDGFWTPARCGELPPGLALSVFDMAVNQGQGAAVRALQRAVGATADGAIGPRTVAKAQGHNDPAAVMSEFLVQRVKRYSEIDAHRLATFGTGWFRRAVAIDRQSTTFLN